MKKVKIKERFENAVEAFFENDEKFGASEIVLNNGASLLNTQPAEEKTAANFAQIINLAKKVFLVLPGAFFVYKLLLTYTYLTFQDKWNFPSNYSYHLQMFFIDNPLVGIFFLTLASFMMFVGVGNLKETKNLIFPGSIISLSLILSFLFSFLHEPMRGPIIMNYSAYLFPLVLIAAGYAKHCIEENKASKN